MKTFFSVFISYIVLCVFGTALCSLLFMVYAGCLKYVVAQPLTLLSIQEFLFGFRYALPLIVLVIPMFLVLTFVRHSRRNRLIGIITTAVLTSAAWFVLLPLAFKVEQKHNFAYEFKKMPLSSRVFRFSENKLFYYTRVDSQNNADGIVIDTNEQISSDNSFSSFHNVKAEIPDSGNFSDVLVKRVIEIPRLLEKCFIDLTFLIDAGKRALSSSRLSYFFFCSLALALFFVFPLMQISCWRLVNAFYVLFSTALIIKINAVCYGISVYKERFGFLYEFDDKLKSLGSVFSYMESPVCVCINILAVLFFIGIGLAFKIKNHSKLEVEEE